MFIALVFVRDFFSFSYVQTDFFYKNTVDMDEFKFKLEDF